MTTSEIAERRGMDPGLYVLRWVDGGDSLASVGHDDDGRNWFAPTNWIARPGMLGMPSFDWNSVASVESVLLERDWRESAAEKPTDLSARVLAALDLLDRARFRVTDAMPGDPAAEWTRFASNNGRRRIEYRDAASSLVRGAFARLLRAGVLVPEEP